MIGDERGRSILPTLVGCAIIIAGLYYGQQLAIPLVLAALLAFVLAPLCTLLQRFRLPRPAAVLVAVAVSFAVLGGLGSVVARQGASLAESFPAYQSTVTAKWNAIIARVGAVERLTQALAPTAGDGKEQAGKDRQDAGSGLLADVSGLSLARNVALPILGPLGTLGITLIFAFFILLSNEDLRDRLVRLIGRRDLHRTILALNDATGRLSKFFLFQLLLNASFGAIIGVALWIAGLPNPLLWAILAGVMRFVPFLGVVVAAVPPLALAVAIVPGWTLAVVVLALFIVAESVMGQVVEPLIYGHNTGLTPIAVIVATAFWTLIWGPIGLLIATPLTVCLVVIGRHVAVLSFLDIVLGDRPPLEPPETFYQRALEGRGMTLLPDARKRIASTSYIDYCDRVMLPGLALAQADLARDDAAFEHLDAIHEQIAALLDGVNAAAARSDAAQAHRAPPAPWRSEAAILCLPGRGQLDDLAAAMAVHALRTAGFGARTEANAVLSARFDERTSLPASRLCCLSVLEDGSNVAAIQYFLRLMRKRRPGAILVIGLWHADRDSALLGALRASGGDEHVVLSLGELVAFCQATVGRQAVRETGGGAVAHVQSA